MIEGLNKNIYGHRQDISEQLLALADYVNTEDFVNSPMERRPRALIYKRMELLIETLQTIDDSLYDF